MKAKVAFAGVVLRAVLVAALVLVFVPQAYAQSGKPKANGTGAPAKSQTTAKPAGGQQEGIKVHGHWVIEVRNPNGTLASRSEFENALEPQGAFILSNVMAGSFPVHNWRLIVGSMTSLCPSQPRPEIFGQGACIIAPAADNSALAQSKDLTSFAVGTDPNQGGSLVVKGSFTAEAEATIEFVRSGVNSTGFFFFSSKTLAPADQRHVVAGQIVQVTLTITFS